jgi:hypothetical protein
MRPTETIATLASFEHRGPGTDAERRAANWLTAQLQSSAHRDAQVETFWCRPNWALGHAWHAALGLAGSLVADSSPRVGGALLILALLSVVSDAVTGTSLGRRLTPERASQNVVSESGGERPSVHLIVTANYDAGRAGLVYRDRFKRTADRLARLTGGRAPGWLAWLATALVWLIVIAVLRLEGHRGTIIGIAQLIPTVGLVLAMALLLELASAGYGPAATDNASGVAAAIALVQALDAAPPRHLTVDLVLAGAGDGGGIGLRHFLRGHNRKAPTTVVVGIAACGAGDPCWYVSDGALIPLAYFSELRRQAAAVASEDPGLGARPSRSRGHTPALPARERRLPAIALGSTERPARPDDTVDRIDADSVDRTVELGLLLTDATDAHVGRRAAAAQPTPV